MRYPCQSTNRFLLLYCLLGYLLPVICGCAQGLQIDEIMLNNRTVLADEHGDYADWIELVNHSSQSISIAGFGLSDRPDQPFRYRCPDVELEPGERWIVFCSGKQESQALRKPLWQASPPKLDGLILHLDAAWEQALIMDAQGGVTAWMDRSPGMSHAVFAGSGPAPALGDQDPQGRRSVFFDGKGQFMAMKEVIGRTLFLVAAEHPFASNHYRTPIGHRDEVTLHRGGNRAILNPILGSAYESQGVYLNGREIDATQTRFPCSPSILQFQASSPQRFNLLGSDRLIDNYFWHGHLHEILLYDRPLAANEILQVESYLEDKWALPSQYTHAAFTLSQKTSQLFLTDPDGDLLQIRQVVKSPSDISQGWVGLSAQPQLSNPTPGKPNEAHGYQGMLEAPRTSLPAGAYAEPIELVLNHSDPEALVLYTLDGSDPAERGQPYLEPLELKTTTIVKTRALRHGYLPSPMAASSYVIGFETTLPMLALSSDPPGWFDPHEGIFSMGPDASQEIPFFGANFWKDEEHRTFLEWIPPGQPRSWVHYLGSKIHGGWSRANPQKSIALIARSRYGAARLEADIFPEQGKASYKQLLLRNGGNDWWQTMLRDALIHRLAEDMGLTTQAYLPVHVFLEGAYHGLYNLRERANEHHLAQKHSLSTDELDMVDGFLRPLHGHWRPFKEAFEWLDSIEDTQSDAFYQSLAERFDLDQFADYLAVQIYAGNRDWPHNNLTLWRSHAKEKGIRWLLNDLDMSMNWHGLASQDGTLGRLILADNSNPVSSLLNKGLGNERFKRRLAKRLLFRLENQFSPERVLSQLNQLADGIRPEMGYQISRWGGQEQGDLIASESLDQWEQHLQRMREFATQRNAFLRTHLAQWLSLEVPVPVSLEVLGKGTGRILVDGLPVELDSQREWSSYAFDAYPLGLEVQPDADSLHGGWDGGGSSQPQWSWEPALQPKVQLDLQRLADPIAVLSEGKVLINEIMYHPKAPSGQFEFLELINVDDHPINLADWSLEGGVDYLFPDKVIQPGAYLVVVGSKLSSEEDELGVLFDLDAMGPWDGQLSNSGESIRLKDAEGREVDRVDYWDEGDWSQRVRGELDHGYRGWTWSDQHDGGGSSLERRSILVSGLHGQNWGASSEQGGSPGKKNSLSEVAIAPLILNVNHWPPLPQSSQAVWVSADISSGSDPIGGVELHYRVGEDTAWHVVPMFDDGLNADRRAGDGRYGTWIEALPDQSVCEFFLRAEDGAGRHRTWPALTEAGQLANALYQVDDAWQDDPESLPLMRAIMRPDDRLTLEAIGKLPWNASSDAAMNATFMCYEKGSWEVHYGVGLRLRGSTSRAGPVKNRRVNFSSDQPWRGRSAIALNAVNTPSQVLGSVMLRAVGLPAASARPVRWLENGVNYASPGFPQFGCFAQVDVLDDRFVKLAFPGDDQGHLYRPSGSGNLEYLGEDPQAYKASDYYRKGNQQEEDDWSDLIDLTRYLSQTDPASFERSISSWVNVPNWLRYFAMDALLGNTETSFGNGGAGDYALYLGQKDTASRLIPYDLDSLLGMGAPIRNLSILRAANRDIPRRFLSHPSMAPRYFRELIMLAEDVLEEGRLRDMVQQTLGFWTSDAFVESIIEEALTRRQEVLDQLKGSLQVDLPLPFADPSWLRYYQAPSGQLVLTGRADRLHTNQIRVGGHPASWSPWEGIWVSEALDLHSGLNEVTVQSLDSDGELLETVYLPIFLEPDLSAIPLGGSLSADTMWDASMSPVTLNDDLVIPEGITLRIAAGTTVEFNQGAGLVVKGRLLIEGEPTRRVYLTRNRHETMRWRGIRFEGSMEANQIAHATLEWSESPGIVLSGSRADVVGLKWIGAYSSFVRSDYSSLRISSSYFPDVTQGEPISGVGIPDNGYWIIDNCYFGKTTGYADVIDFTGGKLPGPVPLFLNNRFAGGSDDGLDLDGSDAYIEGNVFMDFHKANTSDSEAHAIATGLYNGDSSNITLVRNVFINNDHDLLLKEWSRAYAAHNTFVGATLGSVSFMELVRRTQPPVALEMVGNIFYQTKILHALEEAQALNPKLTVRIDETLMPSSLTIPGVGNQVGDPLFVDLTEGNVALEMGSMATGMTSIGLDAGAMIEEGLVVQGPPITSSMLTVRELKLRAGGAGIQAYRYRLDGGAWSSAFPVEMPMNFSELGQGAHRVEVMGQKRSGIWLDRAEQIQTWGWIEDSYMSTVKFSEVLAAPVAWHGDAFKRFEFVELVNLSPVHLMLKDFTISDDAEDPGRFRFPANSLVEPGQHFVIGEKGQHSYQGWVLPFGLKDDGETLYLFQWQEGVPHLVDEVCFGRQAPGWSIGRDARGKWQVGIPTPASDNHAVASGDPSKIWISEWMPSGDESYPQGYLEWTNQGDLPVNLGQWYLSDYPHSLEQAHRLPGLSFIGPGESWVMPLKGLWESFSIEPEDELTTLALHAFDDSIMGRLVMLNPVTGLSLQPASSLGSSWLVKEPTPGWLGDGEISTPRLMISELMADNRQSLSPKFRFSDWIELFNYGSQPVALEGWSLTDDPAEPGKHLLNGQPALNPDERRVIWLEDDFSSSEVNGSGFALKATGDQIWLFYLEDSLQPLPVDGVTFGRQTPSGSLIQDAGTRSWHLGIPTPGGPNLSQPMGAVKDLRINEWVASPDSGADWLELSNFMTWVSL